MNTRECSRSECIVIPFLKSMLLVNYNSFHAIIYSIGEPNDSGGEDCVMMYIEDGMWNDLDCGEVLQFICEKKW